MSTTSSHPELEFFNSLSGRLEVELSEPPERISPNLENQKAPASARIRSISLRAEVFEAGADFRALTHDELASVAFRATSITLRGEGGGTVNHQAPNGEYFTVQQLLDAVEETERQTRGSSEWFGGVDAHHVFFEGLSPDNGTWRTHWGS